ncbi:unnamed protein product [Caenorhabditis sp. 36 PRJEB53466]|nr:unnamed protein product [Caenorhabditis sp. 36 PRJEB53466]
MAEAHSTYKVDFFPTVDEIVNNAPVTTCDECGKTFVNAPACKFHKLKRHLTLDVPTTNEKRLYKRTCPEPRVLYAYHCPDPLCSSKKEWFDGVRNLRQHYFRAHAEKKFVCPNCGFKSALKKDVNYHKRKHKSGMKIVY